MGKEFLCCFLHLHCQVGLLLSVLLHTQQLLNYLRFESWLEKYKQLQSVKKQEFNKDNIVVLKKERLTINCFSVTGSLLAIAEVMFTNF